MTTQQQQILALDFSRGKSFIYKEIAKLFPYVAVTPIEELADVLVESRASDRALAINVWITNASEWKKFYRGGAR